MGTRFTSDDSNNAFQSFTDYQNTASEMRETNTGAGELNYLSTILDFSDNDFIDVLFYIEGNPIHSPIRPLSYFKNTGPLNL